MADHNSPPSGDIKGLPDPAAELPWSSSFVMQAIEILPVARDGDGVLLSLKPEHADSFVVGWPAGAKPESISEQALRGLGLEPIVLHSTSWRHSGDEVILTYIAVVMADEMPTSWQTEPVMRDDLARGSATAPPPIIGISQVLEHALRHLAWLVSEDQVIAAALPGWQAALSTYIPEPFRALGDPPQGPR